MTDEELKKYISEAAEEGAKNALFKVGLSDQDAYSDVKELRSLLDTWRDTKRTITRTVVAVLTTAFLSFLAAGAWFSQYKGN